MRMRKFLKDEKKSEKETAFDCNEPQLQFIASSKVSAIMDVCSARRGRPTEETEETNCVPPTFMKPEMNEAMVTNTAATTTPVTTTTVLVTTTTEDSEISGSEALDNELSS